MVRAPGLIGKPEKVRLTKALLGLPPPSLHIQTYYINNITPQIGLNNFRYEPILQKKLNEWDNNLRALGNITDEEEQIMKQKLERVKLVAGTPDSLIAERMLRDREEIRRKVAEGGDWKDITMVIERVG
jgi:hypothetical protein